MTRRIIIFLLLAAASAAAYSAHAHYETEAFLPLFYTLLALTVIYVVFKIALEEIALKKVRDSKTRYSFRKAVSFGAALLAIIVILRIWVTDPQALLVSYGLVGAGAAIALQDFFKNIVGGIMLFAGGIFRVGDRIEIGDTVGDVMDIGVFYTTLLEIRGWIDGDQATGRLAVIPNGLVLSRAVHNYTKDHGFIWDEVSVPITYESDWRRARDCMISIAREEVKDTMSAAKHALSRLEEKYYLSPRETDPAAFLRLTDNWIQLTVRYVADVRARRAVNTRIHERVLEMVEKENNIDIASETIIVKGSRS